MTRRMTRKEFVAKCEELGINCDVAKRMTDEEFDREVEFQKEKILKEKRP